MRLPLVSAIALALAACQAEAPPTAAAATETAAIEAPAATAVEPAATETPAAEAAAHVGLMAHEPWTRPLAPGATVAAGYMRLMNHTAQAEALVSARADGVGSIEIHDMAEVDGMMQMRPIEGGLALDVDASVALQPGGKHLMFIDVSRPWVAGDSVPVALEFASGQTLEVDFQVREGGTESGDQSRQHAH